MLEWKRWNNLHAHIARDTWPNGGELQCEKCGHKQRFTHEQAAVYLRKGWPEHCDLTMHIISHSEKVNGQDTV